MTATAFVLAYRTYLECTRITSHCCLPSYVPGTSQIPVDGCCRLTCRFLLQYILVCLLASLLHVFMCHLLGSIVSVVDITPHRGIDNNLSTGEVCLLVNTTHVLQRTRYFSTRYSWSWCSYVQYVATNLPSRVFIDVVKLWALEEGRGLLECNDVIINNTSDRSRYTDCTAVDDLLL